MNWQEVGRRLAQAREAAGLTQEAAGALVGAHFVTIGRWEAGASVKGGKLARLADAYGVSVAWLMGEGGGESTAPLVAGLPLAYWRGMQEATMVMMRTVVELQTRIGGALAEQEEGAKRPANVATPPLPQAAQDVLRQYPPMPRQAPATTAHRRKRKA